MGHRDSASCQRNHVQTDTDFLGLATIRDPVAVHLKYINQWEVKIIQEVINANIGAEVTPIVIPINCPLIGDISILGICLRKTEITKEIIYLGKKQVVKETDNWAGE